MTRGYTQIEGLRVIMNTIICKLCAIIKYYKIGLVLYTIWLFLPHSVPILLWVCSHLWSLTSSWIAFCHTEDAIMHLCTYMNTNKLFRSLFPLFPYGNKIGPEIQINALTMFSTRRTTYYALWECIMHCGNVLCIVGMYYALWECIMHCGNVLCIVGMLHVGMSRYFKCKKMKNRQSL